ncbi:iron-sulfur cluster biosynthesis family protein [Paenibacillus roseipurpureus]|uniref:Iron-sulfur cluster biosynthesis family protein n=1 Tax=Paenibacillus roseopurpureus TaxID=2918901 RepID=A0AA96RKQ2_9BACL|nr:iron-sulfur cluster biosynthesis family protein [Paenibacillus sp. MBLB1832]WNR42307.1 iron-sulfur cluster biosynthesis family protein [Paenibacillus sp. MBLB1832]
MYITFTDTALERLTPFTANNNTLLKLVFDTEGCGCSVNGVPTLWLVPEASKEDATAETNAFPLIYKAKDEIFFEENMKIDYHEATKSYILKSNNQIYNAGMSLVDKR